jgi:hypothetical protein
VLPTDIDGRRILATERHQLLRNGRPGGRPGNVRRRVAGLLVEAGVRLAPEAAPRLRASR